MSLSASLTLLSEGLDALIGAETERGGRAPEFRMSSMPYCPLLFAINSETPYDEKYRSDFYFGSGTAMHHLLQKWLPRGKLKDYIFGDWACMACGNKGPRGLTPAKPCKACGGTRWHYDEIEIKWRGLSGHVDMLLRMRAPKGSKHKFTYVVVDFKSAYIDYSTERSNYPTPPNVVQITGYCAALRESLGLNVIGWHLAYIDRRRPLDKASNRIIVSGKFGPREHKHRVAELRHAMRAHKQTGAFLAAPDRAKLGQLIELRPCRTKADYAAKMASKFHYEEKGCEHLTMCAGKGSSDKLLKHFARVMEMPNERSRSERASVAAPRARAHHQGRLGAAAVPVS